MLLGVRFFFIFLLRRLNSPWVRVGVLAATLLLLGAAWSARAAQARTGAVLGALGEQMLNMAPSHQEGAHAVAINGFHMAMDVKSLDMSKDAALTLAKENCVAASGMATAEFGGEQLDKFQREAPARYQNGALGMLVEETPQGLVVACLDTQGRQWFSSEMLAQIERFMRTGELAELGVVRYTLIRGNDEHATLVRLWSEGRAPILDMFPDHGDVPGSDHPFVPRVGGRRILSAQVAVSRLVTYEHEESPEEVWEQLEPKLTQARLQLKDLEGKAAGKRAWVRKGDVETLVTIKRFGAKTYLSMFDLP